MKKKKSFIKFLTVRFNLIKLSVFIIEKMTLVFDFDETLAKVHLDKKVLNHYDDQVDILTSKKTLNVI